jgi:hypothetical protein
VNGRLYYCSGKKQGSTAREVSPVVSEKIEKGATEGYLIYGLNFSIDATLLQTKTSTDKVDVNHLHPEKVTTQSGLMINALIEKEICNRAFSSCLRK